MEFLFQVLTVYVDPKATGVSIFSDLWTPLSLKLSIYRVIVGGLCRLEVCA